MESQALNSICSQIYRRFPEVNGVHPKVQPYSGDKFLLIFTGKGTAANGKAISHNIRVVASQDGKIIKVTSSR